MMLGLVGVRSHHALDQSLSMVNSMRSRNGETQVKKCRIQVLSVKPPCTSAPCNCQLAKSRHYVRPFQAGAPPDRIVRRTLAIGGAVGVACRPAMSIGSLSVIRSPEARFSN